MSKISGPEHSLHYTFRPERTKTKNQTKYHLEHDGNIVGIEINRVPGLGAFLEIEGKAVNIDEVGHISTIDEIFRLFDIDPELDISQDGVMVSESYQSMLKRRRQTQI